MMTTQTEPLLLSLTDAAKLLGVSRSKFALMDKEGRVPRAKRFGKMRMWSRSELLAWEQAGCPTREEWEAMQ